MKSVAVVTVACMLASASAFTAPTMATRAVGNPFARNKAKTEAAAKTVPVKKAAAAPKKAAAAAPVAKKAAPAPKKAAAAAPVPKKAAAAAPVPKKAAAAAPVAKKAAPAPKKAAAAAPAPKKAAAAAPVAKKAAPAPKKAAAPAPKKAAAAAPVSRAAPPASQGYPSIAASASKIKFNVSGGGNKAPPSPYKVPNFADARLQIQRDPAFYKEAAKSRKTAFSRNQEYVFEDGLTELERRQRATIPGFLTGSAKSQADLSAIRDDVQADTLIFGLDPDRFQLLFLSVFGLFTLVGCLSGNLKF